jgi:hypothetical protein
MAGHKTGLTLKTNKFKVISEARAYKNKVAQYTNAPMNGKESSLNQYQALHSGNSH